MQLGADGAIQSQDSRQGTLTGGFGVDFHAISSGFERSVYVERNEQLCAISSRNFQLLGSNATVVCDQAETYLQQMEHADLIYLDPARRDEHGARTYSIEDCTPNVLELLPMLLAKADRIMLKLSPMLDWHKAVSQLRGVSEVHVVSVQNECKELLLMVSGEEEAEAPQHTEPKETKEEGVRLVCVNLLADGSEQVFSPINHQLARPKDAYYQRDARTPNTHHPSPTQEYLYEPNSSIMKAGCFDEIAVFYHITELSANSHLFVSDHEVVGFLGRKFRIESVSSLNKRELRNTLANVERANITVRNFPMSAETLRKRLRIKDGGDVYIFATTTADGEHQLFICRKIA